MKKSYSILDLLSMESCTGCRSCAQVCPAVSASKDGRLSGIYRLDILKRINRKRAGLFPKLFSKKLPLSEKHISEYGNSVFKCTLCGNCERVCPVGIGLTDIWVKLREDLVRTGVSPKQIERIKENVENSHNVFDEDNEERAEWVEDMEDAPDHGYVKETAEIVYFTGCVASYFPMAQKIAISLAEIFQAFDVDFTLLGEDEWCCGFPLVGAGLSDITKDIIAHNIDVVKKRQAKTIVFACPSCYEMWLRHYPIEIEMLHATEYLARLLRSRKVSFKNIDMTVTYHDPCDLGRGAGVFDAPREIIARIPGVKLVELEHNRDACLCCGGGGNLEMIDSGLSQKIAEIKMTEVMASGADAVITSCQQCVRTMTGHVRRNNMDLKVMDVAELLRLALIS